MAASGGGNLELHTMLARNEERRDNLAVPTLTYSAAAGYPPPPPSPLSKGRSKDGSQGTAAPTFGHRSINERKTYSFGYVTGYGRTYPNSRITFAGYVEPAKKFISY
jgi:hypothetical protein